VERPATIAAYYHPLAAIAPHHCEEFVDRDVSRPSALVVIALTISLTAALYTLARGEGFAWAILSFFCLAAGIGRGIDSSHLRSMG